MDLAHTSTSIWFVFEEEVSAVVAAFFPFCYVENVGQNGAALDEIKRICWKNTLCVVGGVLTSVAHCWDSCTFALGDNGVNKNFMVAMILAVDVQHTTY